MGGGYSDMARAIFWGVQNFEFQYFFLFFFGGGGVGGAQKRSVWESGTGPLDLASLSS